ncbi:putative ribonuclease H-like domain-containing protein [Tanacetum coccineum]
MGTYVAVTQVDPNEVGGSTISVSSGSQDTTGPSNVHKSVHRVENTRPVSCTNVVPMKPTSVPGSANDVTNRPDFLRIIRVLNGADVAVSLESVRIISERFANLVYGFFLGKRIAYPVVDNYVKNTWSKYGLVKSMMNSANGLFFFKFSSKDEMNSMLENDPWFILNTLLICKE